MFVPPDATNIFNSEVLGKVVKITNIAVDVDEVKGFGSRHGSQSQDTTLLDPDPTFANFQHFSYELLNAITSFDLNFHNTNNNNSNSLSTISMSLYKLTLVFLIHPIVDLYEGLFGGIGPVTPPSGPGKYLKAVFKIFTILKLEFHCKTLVKTALGT